MPVDHPQFGTFCCICFERLTAQTAAVDTQGTKWDTCKGMCATLAGIEEGPELDSPHEQGGAPTPLPD